MEMQNYRVAVVGMDLSKMDDVITRYLPTLLEAMPLEKVVFVHIAKTLELPDEILEKYPDLIAPIDESIAVGIEDKVKSVFEDRAVEYDIVVQEGSPLESFLKIARIKNADLIVMGRKRELEGSGLLSGHIVRKSPASILFVTENHQPFIKNILVPVDFSRHSSLALTLAGQIQSRTKASIDLANVYAVPTGYHKTGKGYDEFAEIMKGHAESGLSKFLSSNDFDVDLPCEFMLEKDESVSDQLYHHAQNIHTDLIIIGSRGRTKTAALLIGSIVEKLVFADVDIPVMVVKNKGENMGFFEALMRI